MLRCRSVLGHVFRHVTDQFFEILAPNRRTRERTWSDSIHGFADCENVDSFAKRQGAAASIQPLHFWWNEHLGASPCTLVYTYVYGGVDMYGGGGMEVVRVYAWCVCVCVVCMCMCAVSYLLSTLLRVRSLREQHSRTGRNLSSSPIL